MTPEHKKQIQLFEDLGKLWGACPTRDNPRWIKILSEFVVVPRTTPGTSDIESLRNHFIGTENALAASDSKVIDLEQTVASQFSELSRLREDNERLVKYVFELGERLDGKAASLTELKKVLSETTKKLVDLDTAKNVIIESLLKQRESLLKYSSAIESKDKEIDQLREALTKIKKLADYENSKTECLLYSKFSFISATALYKAKPTE